MLPFYDRNAILDMILRATAGDPYAGSAYAGYAGDIYNNLPEFDPGTGDGTGRLPGDVPTLPPPIDPVPVPTNDPLPGVPSTGGTSPTGDRTLPSDPRDPMSQGGRATDTTGRAVGGDRTLPPPRTPTQPRDNGRAVATSRTPVGFTQRQGNLGPGYIEPLPGIRIPIFTPYGMPGTPGYVNPFAAGRFSGAQALAGAATVPSYRSMVLDNIGGIIPRKRT